MTKTATAPKFQQTADQLSDDEKREAETIARKLFGVYDWNGILQSIQGTPGMAHYINRAIMPKIRPEGTRWLVGENQTVSEWGCPVYREGYGIVQSTYYIKSF